MRAVFADSGYWIALLDERDPLHTAALALRQDSTIDSVVTTQLVIVEVLNFMSSLGPYLRERAAAWAERLFADPHVEVLPQGEARFAAAVERYKARLDQSWSLTDCASFLAMEELGIREALAYDRDFEQAGFSALLR